MSMIDVCAQSRGLLKSLFSCIQHGIVLSDMEGKILFVNSAVEKIFGLSEQDLEDINLSSFFTSEDMTYLYPNLMSMARRRRSFKGELMLERGNGARFFAYMIFQSYFEEETGRALIIVSIQDIDKEKQLQKSMESIHFEDLVKVADGIAHELRNPLVGIGGFVNRLYKSCKADKNSDKYYKYIIHNLEKVEGLVQKIQFYINFPDPDFKTEPVEDLMEKAVEPYLGRIEESGIDLSIRVQNAELRVDADLAVSALSMLIENALDALTEKGRLEINGKIDHGHFMISVFDSAGCLSPSDLSHIFNPFFTTKPHGTGIDLALVKRILDVHGGHVEVECQPGEKTEFLLSFPLERRRKIRARPY